MNVHRALGLILLTAAAIGAGSFYWFFQRPSSTPIIGRPAPAVQLSSLDGSSNSLASYRGRPVIVNFWATWCEPCKEEMPLLQTSTSSHPDLVVLGIDNVEAPSKVRPFVDQLGVRFPILLDEDGSVLEHYQVLGLPTSFFVDRSGTLRSIYRGALTEDVLRDSLAAIY